MIKLLASQKQLSLSDLEDFEATTHVKLPKALKDFYLAYNGGYSETTLFKNADDDYPINEFLSIKYGDMRVDTSFEMFRADSELPSQFVPFAMDAGGDYYGFSLQPAEYGKIYLFSSDSHFSPDGELIYICDSFSTLVNNMVSDEYPQ